MKFDKYNIELFTIKTRTYLFNLLINNAIVDLALCIKTYMLLLASINKPSLILKLVSLQNTERLDIGI